MKMKKILCIMLCAVIILGVFTACGKKEESTVPNPEWVDIDDTIESIWLHSEDENIFMVFNDGDFGFGIISGNEVNSAIGTYEIYIEDGKNMVDAFVDYEPFVEMRDVIITGNTLVYTAKNGNKATFIRANDSQVQRIENLLK
ncbi:MAG: hypothetical protein IKB50_01365 [Clostridia bacterium]|nr:hypothetical protein [Clostridia bacterium]